MDIWVTANKPAPKASTLMPVCDITSPRDARIGNTERASRACVSFSSREEVAFNADRDNEHAPRRAWMDPVGGKRVPFPRNENKVGFEFGNLGITTLSRAKHR